MPRSPKPFGPDFRDSAVYGEDLRRLVGMERHHSQAEVVTMAPTKDVAVAQLAACGLNYTPHYICGRQGDPIAELIDLGLLTDDGSTLVFYARQKDRPVVRIAADRSKAVVAHWRSVDYSLRLVPVQDESVDPR